MTNMTNNNRVSQKAPGQIADDPDYLHLISLFSTFHISSHTTTNACKKGMNSLSPEIILEIASYFFDDYAYCKLTNDIWIEATSHSTTSAVAAPATTPARTYYFICPYAALAMTNRYLWSVIPRMLRRPIPLEIIEAAENFLRIGRGETRAHWARKYGKMRGWEMVRWKTETKTQPEVWSGWRDMAMSRRRRMRGWCSLGR